MQALPRTAITPQVEEARGALMVLEVVALQIKGLVSLEWLFFLSSKCSLTLFLTCDFVDLGTGGGGWFGDGVRPSWNTNMAFDARGRGRLNSFLGGIGANGLGGIYLSGGYGGMQILLPCFAALFLLCKHFFYCHWIIVFAGGGGTQHEVCEPRI